MLYFIVALVIVVNLIFAFALGCQFTGRPLRRALRRAQGQMRRARWLIYRDWSQADDLLGLAERSISKDLHDSDYADSRPVGKQPTYEELQMFLDAHREDYPGTYYDQ